MKNSKLLIAQIICVALLMSSCEKDQPIDSTATPTSPSTSNPKTESSVTSVLGQFNLGQSNTATGNILRGYINTLSGNQHIHVVPNLSTGIATVSLSAVDPTNWEAITFVPNTPIEPGVIVKWNCPDPDCDYIANALLGAGCDVWANGDNYTADCP